MAMVEQLERDTVRLRASYATTKQRLRGAAVDAVRPDMAADLRALLAARQT